MKIIFLIFFLFSGAAWGQYYPRGTSFNNGYLPNLDEPDKWIVTLDGMFEWQREKNNNGQTSYQSTHANFNVFYGGKNFRGGAQVIHDFSFDVKDLSLGAGFALGRPLFLELGAGYLNRVGRTSSSEGWSYSAKVGYYYRWITHVSYRVRVRLSLMYNYKRLNDVADPRVSNFYPFLGFEFET